MTAGTRVSLPYRICCAALATVFLLPATAVATPATEPSSPSAPTAPGTTSNSTRIPPAAETTSPVDVEVGEQTEAFRTELSRRQALLDEFLAQLDELDRELSLATEAYNAAADRLADTRELMATAQQGLATAEEAYESQNALAGERATAIYKAGTLAPIWLLLEADGLSDFLTRLRFLNTLGLADAEVAESLRTQRDLIERTAKHLKDAELESGALEFELRARQIEVMLRIQERQQMLAEAQGELLELLDAQAARRQQEEAELLRRVLSSAGDAGIDIEANGVVETALAYHGVPYLWGGKNPSGFDCSGLLFWVFRQHGVTLPHYSGAQFRTGERVVPAALQPGDAVFFGSPVHHVGIFIGADYFIHAPRTGDFVRIDRLSTRRDYAGARRYDWVPRQGAPTGISAPRDLTPESPR